MATIFIIAAVITSIYIVFIIWVRSGLKHATSYIPDDEPNPSVSVVVSARNEASNLTPLLDSLANQNYPANDLQLIIVDDNSTDESWDILTNRSDIANLTIHKIDSTPTGWGPKKWALTEAVRLSNGELIIATDADCRPGSEWVSTVVKHFSEGVGMVMGPAPVAHDRSNRWREALYLESSSLDALAAGGASRGIAITCTGRNIAYRRSVFDEIGGYDGIAHLVSGDDDLLMHKITASGKWKVRFMLSEAALVPSPPPAGLAAFIRQRLRHASKGLVYFRIPSTRKFRLLLPLFLVANMVSILAPAMVIIGFGMGWLILFVLKLFAEGLLVYRYLAAIKSNIRISTFILVGIIHPFYVVCIGILGNFYRLSWKDRKFHGSSV